MSLLGLYLWSILGASHCLAGELHMAIHQIPNMRTVGILVAMLGVAMGNGLAGAALVPMSQLWRGPGAVAMGGLQCRY